MALHPRMFWNDGEAIEHSDFQKQGNYLYSLMLEACTRLSGAEMGNAMNMTLSATTDGMDPYLNGGFERSNLQDSQALGGAGNLNGRALFIPYPFAGPVRSTLTYVAETSTANYTGLKVGSISVEGGVLVQRYNANTPGTIPSALTSTTPMLMALSATSHYDITSALSALTLPGVGYRFDHIGIQLGYETGASESRDFKDAATDALSTQSVDKQERNLANFEIVSGGSGTNPDPTSYLTAGYGAFLSVKRDTAETQPRNGDDFYYWPYPMRLGIEDVWPQDAVYSNHYRMDNANYMEPADQGGLNIGYMEYAGAPGTTIYYAAPRNLNESCRLVGVAYQVNGGTLSATPSMEIVRLQWAYDLASVKYTTLFTIDPSTHSYAGQDGMIGVFEYDWTIPIWGNGRTYGPIFNVLRNNTPQGGAFGWHSHEKVAFRMSLTQTDFWAIGPVRFYYLY